MKPAGSRQTPLAPVTAPPGRARATFPGRRGSESAQAIAAARAAAPARTQLVAEIAVLLVMLCWGANIVAVKSILADLPPIGFAFLRFGSAFLILLALLRWREGSVGLPRSDILPLILLGLAGFGVYQDLWATALGITTASNSALLTSATPIPTMLIAAAIGADVLSPAKAVGALVSLAGTIGVVVATHGISLSGASVGDLMTLAAVISWSLYVAFGSPVLRRHSPLRTATWAIGFGCLGMLPFAAVQLARVDPSRIHPSTVGLFLFSAVFAAAISNVVMFQAVKVLGPTRAMLYLFLVPVFAVVMAAAFLGEAIVAGQLAGGAAIVGGILMARSGRLRGRLG